MNRLVRRSAVAAVLALVTASCSSQEAPDPAAGDAEPAPTARKAMTATTLIGTVGTSEEPEAFKIALTTADGKPVKALPAGRYTVVVDDVAQIHNFHLTGTDVDLATDIGGTGKKSFDVTFKPGTYRYLCDPHPYMSGDFRVV